MSRTDYYVEGGKDRSTVMSPDARVMESYGGPGHRKRAEKRAGALNTGLAREHADSAAGLSPGVGDLRAKAETAMRLEVTDAIAQLSKSDAGRAAILAVFRLLDGPSLDFQNQDAVETLLSASWAGWPGLTLDALRNAVPKGGA